MPDQPGPWRGPDWAERRDRLAAPVYIGVRDGGLSPEAAFDLAMFLSEPDNPSPVPDELATASLSGGEPARLARLAREALALAGYAPDFATEPRLLAALEQALAAAARDLRAAGLNSPARLVVMDCSEPPHAWVQFQGSHGHSSGLGPGAVDLSDPARSLVMVADELQEAVMDALFTAWPVCPRHHFGAHARTDGGEAVWWCSGGTGHAVAAIGAWPA